jgi:4-hydroxy-3-methylbut-2-enyl diphosphate reductase IspH
MLQVDSKCWGVANYTLVCSVCKAKYRGEWYQIDHVILHNEMVNGTMTQFLETAIKKKSYVED